MIEIDLQKLERGTKTEWRTVKRGGKTFRQRFKTGKKETVEMSDSDIGDAFINGKSIPLTIDTVSSKGDTTIVVFKEKPWHAEITARHITKEKPIKPGSRIIEWRKYYQETEMSLYKGDTSISTYNTTRIRTDVDNSKDANEKITKGAELVNKKINGSLGLKLIYDSVEHKFNTPEELEQTKKRETERKIKNEMAERKKEERKVGYSPEILKIKSDLDTLRENKQFGPAFTDKPEIIYGFIEGIIRNEDAIFGHLPDKNIITGNPSEKAKVVESGKKLLTMTNDAALEYIKDPNNMMELADILSEYMTVMT